MPYYWINETSGALRAAVEAYLNHKELTKQQIETLRLYFLHWISDPAWRGDVDTLRRAAEAIESRRDIHEWLREAEIMGIDPL